ncbi:MAG: hypothetical protein AMXMBFR84_32100 [Candidatus Hydrogenedentota bacterium]
MFFRSHAPLQLKLIGEAYPLLPDALDFETVKRGEENVRTITVNRALNSYSAAIDDMNSSYWVLTQIPLWSSASNSLLEVKLLPHVPYGPFAVNMVIDFGQEKKRIQVKGHVLQPVEARTALVSIGRITAAENLRTLDYYSPYDEHIQFVDADSSCKCLHLVPEEIKDGTLPLKVVFDELPKSGIFKDTIKVTLKVKDETYTIPTPIYGYVPISEEG